MNRLSYKQKIYNTIELAEKLESLNNNDYSKYFLYDIHGSPTRNTILTEDQGHQLIACNNGVTFYPTETYIDLQIRRRASISDDYYVSQDILKQIFYHAEISSFLGSKEHLEFDNYDAALYLYLCCEEHVTTYGNI